MRCEACHGEGWVWVDHIPAVGILTRDPTLPPRTKRSLKRPCPTCDGTGVSSCCEGMVGGPEEATNG